MISVKKLLPFEGYRDYRLAQSKKLEMELNRFAATHKMSKMLMQIARQEARMSAAFDIFQSRFRRDNARDTNATAFTAMFKDKELTNPFSLLARSYSLVVLNVQNINDFSGMQKSAGLTFTFTHDPDSVYQIVKNSGDTLLPEEVAFHKLNSVSVFCFAD